MKIKPKNKFSSRFNKAGYSVFLMRHLNNKMLPDDPEAVRKLRKYMYLAIKYDRDDWMQAFIEICESKGCKTIPYWLMLQANEYSHQEYDFLQRNRSDYRTKILAEKTEDRVYNLVIISTEFHIHSHIAFENYLNSASQLANSDKIYSLNLIVKKYFTDLGKSKLIK
jgi:hypothetical protein